MAIKCTATIYSEYFESSEYYLPGLGLGEKALESRGTNGEMRRSPVWPPLVYLYLNQTYQYPISETQRINRH